MGKIRVGSGGGMDIEDDHIPSRGGKISVEPNRKELSADLLPKRRGKSGMAVSLLSSHEDRKAAMRGLSKHHKRQMKRRMLRDKVATQTETTNDGKTTSLDERMKLMNEGEKGAGAGHSLVDLNNLAGSLAKAKKAGLLRSAEEERKVGEEMDLEVPTSNLSSKLTVRNRAKTVETESQQMKAVASSNAFTSHGFGSLRVHLANTVAAENAAEDNASAFRAKTQKATRVKAQSTTTTGRPLTREERLLKARQALRGASGLTAGDAKNIGIEKEKRAAGKYRKIKEKKAGGKKGRSASKLKEMADKKDRKRRQRYG